MTSVMRLCFGMAIAAADIPSGTLRILPLGDSITQGHDASYGSYRRVLYDLLVADDFTFDFVGGLQNGTFADPDHEGLSGYFIDGIWGQVDGAPDRGQIIDIYTPDIILLMIGTNDIRGGAVPSDAIVTYGHLLDQIATENPAIKTIVGSIPPLDEGDPTAAANVDVFNGLLATLVAGQGANFSFVDTNAALTTADLADGVHPTNDGSDKLAPVWMAGIIAALGGYLVDGSSVILTDNDGNNLLAR